MRNRLIATFILVISCAFSSFAQSPEIQDATENGKALWESSVDFHQMKFQGLEREYYVYKPAGLADNAPLVLVLHGYGGKAKGYFPEMLDCAQKNGFAVVIPQGAPDNKPKPGWIVGYPSQEGVKTDDVAFVSKLVLKVCKDYKLDKKNIFVTGMSNGGEMCYILACLKPDLFNAFAPISGLQMEWAYRKYTAKKPVPIMELHGTEDTTSRWEGDPENKYGWGKYLAVPLAVSNWASINRCTHEITTELPLLTPESNRVILHRYMGGTNGCEVRLYEIVGGKHRRHLGDLDTPGEIWNFFKMYLK